ncbi:kinase-like domain-containing protein [Daldinia vernicosa]|uniref:kinase-like domain-containing protein n=1 Tax=Daldinia vernicosa TaxID=114800 RepID=UPI002008B76E|nr:kinase-like domain-containing protein [Daldinia vernicosa]KAI0843809.1 kinase-like domain-containing protein [Daldinia vernicosa]
MADPDDGQPKNYYERIQLQNYKFRMYRKRGWSMNWDKQYVKDNRQYWSNYHLPRPGPPPIFNDRPEDWQQRRYHNPSAVSSGGPDIEDPQHGSDPTANKARDVLQNVKNYFRSPIFRYQKVLGFGGLGLALHFRYDGEGVPKDVAMKLSLASWESDELRKEGRAMESMLGAAHAVQLVHPESVGKEPMDPYYPKPSEDDSSDDENSSGDESIDQPYRPPRIPRRQRSAEELQTRAQSFHNRYRTWYFRNAALESRKDYLLLEYIEGGDLRMLINRLSDATTGPGGPGGVTPIPNRILWALWLCLIRACVGMKYPPRKFHPERFVREDLIEDAPNARKRWRAKNWVHFDIDPSNIFVGNIERPEWDEPASTNPPYTRPITPGEGPSSREDYNPQHPPTATMSYFSGALRQLNVIVTRGESSSAQKGKAPESESGKRKYDIYHMDRAVGEHLFVPRLKLADFGLAEQIKSHKRNEYYARRRQCGKGGYLAPEQFASDWDLVPGVPDGPEVGENPVAGSYNSATNVWGIALTMWIIITQRKPPLPPQPQIPPGVWIPGGRFLQPDIDDILRNIGPNIPVSYCPLLMDGPFNHVDEDLRRAIYQCMYHYPDQRPTVEELLIQARVGIQKVFPYETDEVINNWVDRFVLSAPTS